jgi:hypothetical protein
MARIGTTHAQSKIYNVALGRYEKEFEMQQEGKKVSANGLTARQRVSEAPLGTQKIVFGGYDAPYYHLDNTEKYFKKLDKATDKPTTEYIKKIGTRSEGSFMQKAESKPYIEIAGKALNGDIHGSAPALDLLDDEEQYKLMTVYKPSMQKPKSHVEKVEEHVAKVGQPYYEEVISRANDDPRKFIKMDLQKTELYPSNMVSKGDGGSNLVFNYKKELNKDTNPITREELYNENFNNKKSVSNFNMMQRDAHTARDILSTYGNKQHTQPESEKVAKEGLRPEIMKGELLEQKQENIIKKEEQNIPVEQNVLFNSVFNHRNPLSQRRRF